MSEDEDTVITAHINRIAREISNQPFGLVFHRPERWAQPLCCFENVLRKVDQSGGNLRFGWTFHHRYAAQMPDQGYIFITHHAVWHSPDGHLVNVTPYPDLKHFPLPARLGEDFLFLVDDNAQPLVKNQVVAPLPLRFFPVGDDARLIAYVENMNREEEQKYSSF